jgi:hypothetical protein
MKTIAIDFDGTLSAYQGWKGPEHLDPPLPGAIDFLGACLDHGFALVIFTTRAPQLVSDWLKTHAPPEVYQCVQITNTKPPAFLMIDDRCLLFTGTYPTVQQIEDFKPWWGK